MATGVSRSFRGSVLAGAWLVAVLVVSGCVQTAAAPETTGVTQAAGSSTSQAAAPATTGSTATLAGATPAALTPAVASGVQPATAIPAASQVVSTTAAATGTPQAMAMPAASQAVSMTEGSDVLYQADFTNPKSGWPDELVFDKYYVGYHEPEYYHVEVHEQNDSAIAPVPGGTFDNFAVESDALVSTANTAPDGDFRYGLAFRRTGSHYYAFAISPKTKTWYVLKSTGSSVETLAKGSSDSIQGLQALDNLRINALGPDLTFFLNGQQVGQLNDSDFTSGEIGLYVETLDSPKTHIHFHTLVVRQPDSTLAQAAPAQAIACQVQSPLLNLRRGPGTNFAPVVALFRGTQLTPLGRSVDQLWIQVRVQESGQQGWVSALRPYVSCNAAIADLPVSQ